MLKWGLIPYWSKDAKIAYKTINARAERIATAPAFRDAWKRRRCLIPTGGFYEWAKTPGGKQLYLICFKNDRLFSFGGLWEGWKDPQSGERVETYTIITTPPNEVSGQIHDRMPLIIEPAEYDRWLSSAEPPADLLQGGEHGGGGRARANRADRAGTERASGRLSHRDSPQVYRRTA
jgi:putative SOS response-associated peptidase YedK